MEDRRLQRIAVDPRKCTRYPGVVLCNGPWVLLAPATEPRPIVILRADREGNLVLPDAQQGGYPVATVESIEATDEQIQAASGSGACVKLAPWQQHPRASNAAFVYDLIVVKEP